MVGGSAAGFPIPTNQPGMELYLNSARGFGLSGNDGDRPNTWPDKSGNARNAGRMTSDFAPVYRTIIANGASPNGTPTLQFDGFDPPFSQFMGTGTVPNPWPSIINGYTFYFLFNLRTAVNSSSGGDLLFCEQANAHWRVSPRNPGGSHFVTYHDDLIDHASGQMPVTGWQTLRFVLTPSVPQAPATGTVTAFRNGTALTFADNTYQFTPGISVGYVIGQLATNLIVGMDAFVGVFAWYSRAHTTSLQRLLEDYWRLQFGLTL